MQPFQADLKSPESTSKKHFNFVISNLQKQLQIVHIMLGMSALVAIIKCYKSVETVMHVIEHEITHSESQLGR